MKKTGKRGAITIAFDDAYLDTYKHAVRYLTKRGLRGTIAVPAGLIGKLCENRPVMGKKEFKNAVKNGHEIASHGITHVNLLKLSALDKKASFREITDSKKILKRRLNYAASSFVFPYIKSNYSRPLHLKAKACYRSVRLTSNKPYFDSLPADDPSCLVGFAIMKKHSVRYLNSLADYAAKNGLWLIEVFHLVGKKNTLSAHRNAPYRFFTHAENFKKHVDHILSKNISVLTQKEAAWNIKT